MQAFRARRLAALITVLVLPASANAIETEFGLGTLSDYSSNILRVENDAQDEITQSAIGNASIRHQAGRTEMSSDYRVVHEHFMFDTQNNTTAINGSTNLSWRPRPTITVNASHNRSTGTVDARVVNNAENRQISNSYNLDATARFRLSKANSLGVTANAGRSTSVRLPNTTTVGNDSNRYQMGVFLDRAMNRRSRASVTLTANHAKFDESDQPEINGAAANLSYNRVGARLSTNASIGYTIQHRAGQQSTTGLTTTAGATWELTQRQRLNFSFSRQITDQNGANGPTPLAQFDVVLGDGGLSALSTSYTARTAWGWTGEKINLGTNFSWTSTSFEDLDRDSQTFNLAFTANWRVLPDVTLNSTVTASRRQFDDDDREDDSLLGTLGLRWSFSEQASFLFDAGYNQRTSDVQAFDEFNTSINLTRNF